MNSSYNKQLLNIIKKIHKELRSFKKTQLNYVFLINELIYLNLKVENILFDNSFSQKNPTQIIKKELNNLLSKVVSFKNFKDFDKNIFIKKKKWNREKTHKTLFQKLWTNFTLKQYKNERLTRYNKRLKINNLKKLVKNKKIVDFGCGHGNFLFACLHMGAEKCDGIDYGIESIRYAKKVSKKLKLSRKTNFFKRTVYNTKLKKNYYDFAIQNGVFHHLDNEEKAYKEMHRVLKKKGYCWIYSCGHGGIMDLVWEMSQKILKEIDKTFVIEKIRALGLSANKEYHMGDGLNALYRYTTFEKLNKKLSKIGFKFIRQLNGGFKTDCDKPFYKGKYFHQKFGSGDLRLLYQKI